ncbi:MAG: sulfatase-like hydrolase/transferase [Planctomycetota bacterium]|jgi:arylsulfatase A
MAYAAADKPNIIIVFNDDMGYADLGCFGAPKNKTPRIDKMAQEGCRFTDFYVASSVCSASRAALMTGCYPQRVGVPGVFFPNRGSHGLGPEHFTIAELLKSVGYKTLAAGKWHLGDEPKFLPTNQGFDSFYGVPYSNDMYPARNMKYADDCLFREGITPQGLEEAFRQTPKGRQPKGMKDKVPLMRDEECIEFPLDQTTVTRRLADESIRFIEESVKEGKPFFLYLANPMPHTPLFVSPEFEGRSAGGLYGDVIEEIDFSTGRVLDALKANGVDENTLVIFTSDNGPWLIKGEHGGSAKPFRDGKGSSYEGGQRVPCVMRWPAKIPAGTECKEPATAMDLLPTFAAMTGAKPPPELELDGHDIQNLMMGGPQGRTPYDAFYYKGDEAVRSGNWKYRVGRRYGMWSGVRAKENPKETQLFNLTDDPGEANNVIEQRPDVAERMKKMFAQTPGQKGVSVIPFSLEPVGTRYEAESGVISGGASVQKTNNASGESRVGSMQKRGASCAVVVDGATGGKFDLTIGYALGSTRVSCSLDIDGVRQHLQLPGTGGWGKPGAARLAVKLNPGSNKIEITSAGGVNLDYFELKRR